MPKFTVCPECEGEGSVGPGFTWTESEMQEYDPDEFHEMQAALRAGQFNVKCSTCKGERVVTPERLEEAADEAAYRAEVAAEIRMGA